MPPGVGAGGVGAGARFVLDGVLTARSRRGLPTATMAINVLGSFLLGLVTASTDRGGADLTRAVLGVGLLGGFTTFSTASVEVVRLVRAARPRTAAGLAVAMLGASLAAALLGLTAGGLLP